MARRYVRPVALPMSATDDLLSSSDMGAPAWDFPRSAAAARILVALGAEHDLDAAACLAGSGIDARTLDDPSAEIEAGQEIAVARNLLRLLGDPPGLGADAGRRYTVGSFGVWGFALLTSPTVRDLVRLGIHYAPLSFAFIGAHYEEAGAEALIIFDDAQIPADVRAFFCERELTKMATLMPISLGGLRGVRFETSFDGDRAAALRRRLPGVDLQAARPRHLVAIDRALLDAPLPQADPHTARALEQQCRQLLDQRRTRRGIAAHVRARLLAQLQDPPSMDEIAAQLHVDPRTLRRQLHDQGTSYRELADEVRHTLADELLRSGGLSVSEVAGRLGYHDAAGFSRAYKRWTGRAPGAQRRRSPVHS